MGYTYILIKGVFVRFGFGELESRKFIDKSRTKQQRTPHEVYYIQPSLASDDSNVRCQECFLYTYTGVGLSALLVSTCRAMREPQFVKRVTELAPRFFICIDYEDKFRQQRESVGCVCERN